jgi:MoaA/NifB/PqqE/SkfB family radical SAM enzyme
MYQYAEVVHWMGNSSTMKILPASIDIDLTNICNQDCFYCNSAEFRKEMPVQKQYSEYIELLDRLASWRSHSPRSYGSLHTITYPGGGEPTLLKGYENVIEHTIDLGFLTSITTNGTNLDVLLNKVPVDKLRKLGWVGIDIDAATEELYETIRRSIPKKSIFNKVINNARGLIDAGVNVDFKILLNDYNDNEQALTDIFMLVRDTRARSVFFRPAIVNNVAYHISNKTLALIDELGKRYQVEHKINLNKYLTRNYKKCHQMFHFPVFCADGGIYTCCENKGNPNFRIGSWDSGDFRDEWLGERHMEVYNQTRVAFCQPCRPNIHNINIQNILDNPQSMETMYL